MLANVFIYLTFIGLLELSFALGESPYQILGIEKHATAQDIKKSYKYLAKIWHPDKNEHPEATKVFVKIKQAYELLSDVHRRRVYDEHGIFSEDLSHLTSKGYNRQSQTSSDKFANFFGKHFNIDNDISFYHQISITTKNFESKLVPSSKTRPYLVIFYNDWCFRCIRLIGTLKQLIRTLEPLGVYFATVNAVNEALLVRKSGIIDIPSLVLVLEGRSYIYRENTYTLDQVKEFIRKKLPYSISQKIDDSNVDYFLGGWIDNRVRAIFFEPRKQTRLRYLITAYTFRHRVAFGFVHLNDNKSTKIQIRYKVDPNLDSLQIFNEDVGRPLVAVSLPEIPAQLLNKIIYTNQYLILPRLSSQQVMEDICPAEWNQPRKRLCVILITENSDAHNHARTSFRNIAVQNEYSIKRVRFAYMFKEKQSAFIDAISRGATENENSQIVIIWRCDAKHIKYEWLKGTQLEMESRLHDSDDHAINETKLHLTNTIYRLLKADETFTYEAFAQNLFDEHAQTVIDRWLSKIKYLCEYLVEHLETEHILALLSLGGTILFMFGIGYVMIYFVRLEEKSLKDKGQMKVKSTSIQKSHSSPELKLHELRAEKYNGMVRLLKPGCRSIILVTDFKTRSKLIPSFHKAVWPYRKSKTLLFGHMLIEKGLVWYSELLRLSICESTTLNINPRNCVGTVIALNGHRKYFCMFHAKHPESDRGEKSLTKITKHTLRDASGPGITTFINAEPAHLLEENLLNGLPNWLDRLFEGTTQRYHINYWPEFPMK